jgi:hypothetical protein
MVHLAVDFTALARFLLQFASTEVNIRIGSDVVLESLFFSQRRMFAPLAHVSGMAIVAVTMVAIMQNTAFATFPPVGFA